MQSGTKNDTAYYEQLKIMLVALFVSQTSCPVPITGPEVLG